MHGDLSPRLLDLLAHVDFYVFLCSFKRSRSNPSEPVTVNYFVLVCQEIYAARRHVAVTV
jgi:hypothetical protein